MLTNLTGR